jgi:hypothetical protein
MDNDMKSSLKISMIRTGYRYNENHCIHKHTQFKSHTNFWDKSCYDCPCFIGKKTEKTNKLYESSGKLKNKLKAIDCMAFMW